MQGTLTRGQRRGVLATGDMQGNKGDTLMWQQGHYMGPDGRIQSGAATLAHSITGHEMDEDMDTGRQEQVIFDMDQGFPPSGYTLEQVDEINQRVRPPCSLRLGMKVWRSPPPSWTPPSPPIPARC